MPSNSAALIQINRDVSTFASPGKNPPFFAASAATLEWSPQETTLRLRQIPANVVTPTPGIGLFLVLPPNPSDGDTYDFVDADGSCSTSNVVAVVADPTQLPASSIPKFTGFTFPPGLGVTPSVAVPFLSASAAGSFTFDAEANVWIVSFGANALVDKQSNYIGTVAATGSAAVSPGDFAGGAAIILAAFNLNRVGAGFFRVAVTLTGTLSGADDLLLTLETLNNVTAFTGGTSIGSSSTPSFRYETGTGAGQAVVVTSADTATTIHAAKETVGAAGDVTITLALDVFLPIPTTAGATAAIILTLADTSATFTGMSLSAVAQETF
jgi:hypothetical protein